MMELTSVQKFLLRRCKEKPMTEFRGLQSIEMHTMESKKLVEYAGRLRYLLTPLGEEIYNKIVLTFKN